MVSGKKSDWLRQWEGCCWKRTFTAVQLSCSSSSLEVWSCSVRTPQAGLCWAEGTAAAAPALACGFASRSRIFEKKEGISLRGHRVSITNVSVPPRNPQHPACEPLQRPVHEESWWLGCPSPVPAREGRDCQHCPSPALCSSGRSTTEQIRIPSRNHRPFCANLPRVTL